MTKQYTVFCKKTCAVDVPNAVLDDQVEIPKETTNRPMAIQYSSLVNVVGYMLSFLVNCLYLIH